MGYIKDITIQDLKNKIYEQNKLITKLAKQLHNIKLEVQTPLQKADNKALERAADIAKEAKGCPRSLHKTPWCDWEDFEDTIIKIGKTLEIPVSNGECSGNAKECWMKVFRD